MSLRENWHRDPRHLHDLATTSCLRLDLGRSESTEMCLLLSRDLLETRPLTRPRLEFLYWFTLL